MKLSNNRQEAMRMMRDIVTLTEQLPGIDCGSCGAPTCRAFAEDIVRGRAALDDCLFVMRDKLMKQCAELTKTEEGEK